MFTHTDRYCLIHLAMVHRSTHYTQDIHYNIPSDFLVHNSPSEYMDYDGWNKYTAFFASMCCSSPINTQVLFYDGNDRHFENRELKILCSHHNQYFILNTGDSVHDQPNSNSTKLKLKILHGNARMNWMRKHGNLKFTLANMNDILVETWETFKISSATITSKTFKKTHPLSLYPTDKGTDKKFCLADTQAFNVKK